MFRRALGALLAVLSLIGVGIATAAPAQAACTYDHVCLYSDANFTGYKRDDYYSRSSWANLYYDGTGIPLYGNDGVASNVSSIDNWDPDSVISVYYNSGFAGPCFNVAVYGSVSNMAYITLWSGLTANDNMNGHQFGGACQGSTYNF